MSNETQLANRINMVGVRSCKVWGRSWLNLTRLEMGNGRVQWSASLNVGKRSFMLGTAKG